MGKIAHDARGIWREGNNASTNKNPGILIRTGTSNGGWPMSKQLWVKIKSGNCKIQFPLWYWVADVLKVIGTVSFIFQREELT